MESITYTSCPCCASSDIAYRLSAKDHTVSAEEFAVWQCGTCGIRFTQHVPDQQSIGRYYQADSYVSHTDTKAGLINTLYHRVRKITLNRKEQLVKNATNIQTGRLLDIGAGTGAFCRRMQDARWTVTGLEPDDSTRSRAAALNKVSLYPAGELFTLPGQSFDAVTLWHVLEHVHALHEYVAQIKYLLTPQGRAFIAVPNYTSYDAATYQQYWAAYDVPRHLYHFSPSSVQWLLQKHQLELVSVQPTWFDSFYVSMLSEQYKNGKAGYLGAFATGLLSDVKALFNKQRCSSVIYVVRRAGS